MSVKNLSKADSGHLEMGESTRLFRFSPSPWQARVESDRLIGYLSAGRLQRPVRFRRLPVLELHPLASVVSECALALDSSRRAASAHEHLPESGEAWAHRARGFMCRWKQGRKLAATRPFWIPFGLSRYPWKNPLGSGRCPPAPPEEPAMGRHQLAFGQIHCKTGRKSPQSCQVFACPSRS